MLGDFLTRLAIALPLVCGLAVATLVGLKRGWFRMPAWLMAPGSVARGLVSDSPLDILCVKAVGPSARLAVVRFAGRELLVGSGPQGFVLLGEHGAGAGPVSLEPHPRETLP